MICVAYLAYSSWTHLEELNSARLDQRGWAYSQLEVDALKLMQELHAIENDETEDFDKFRRKFNVFYSRADLVSTMQENEGHSSSQVDAIVAKLDRIVDLIDGSDAELETSWDTVSQTLNGLTNIARSVAIQTISVHSIKSEEQREHIRFYVSWLFYLLIFILLTLLGTILVLHLQSRTLKSAKEAAQIQKAHSETMLRASADAILLVNAHSNVLDMNAAAERIFAIKKMDLLSHSFVDKLVPPELQADMMEIFERFRKTGKPEIADNGEREFTFQDLNGRVFPAAVHSSLVKDGNQNKFVVYIRDITDQKTYEAELLEMRDQALIDAKEKSRFFAIMSHEMRTPLNGVIAALDLLRTTQMTKEQEKYLNAATQSGDVLMDHINDVLMIERLDEDETLSLEPVILADLINAIETSLKPFADKEDVLLNTHLSDSTTNPVLSDSRALREIFSNLLSNGIKFSPKGSVTLTAQIEKTHDGPHRLSAKVTDSGMGIPNEEIDRIFDDFVSLGDRYEKRKGGTGLGLGIVKRQVERLGGDIRCMSQIGIGSTFVVNLPIMACEEYTAQKIQCVRETSTSIEPMRLLVVDDNAINRELLEVMLKKMGHDVTLAETGHEAVTACEIHTYDAILMDISMPGMNGVEATKLIKSGNGPNKTTSVFAVTANVMAEDKQVFEQAGILATIEKPISRASITAALNGLNHHPTNLPPAHLLIDEQQLQELQDILGRDKMQSRLDAFLTQIEADIARLLMTSDTKDVKTIAHSIAGAAGMIGARHLHRQCKYLETACDQGNTPMIETTLKNLPASLTAFKATLSAFTNE